MKTEGDVMKKKDMYFLVLLGGLLFIVGWNLDAFVQCILWFFNIIVPVLIGLIFAFVLNVPVNAIYRFIEKYVGHPKSDKQETVMNLISLLATLAGIVLVITLAVRLFVPALSSSFQSILPLLQEKIPLWIASLQDHDIDVSFLQKLTIPVPAGDSFMLHVSKAAKVTVSGIMRVVFGLVIGIYVLVSRKKLKRQVDLLLKAFVNEKKRGHIYYLCRLVQGTYTKFLCGQCVEACILGSLIFLVYTILDIPYAGVIGFLTGIFAFVPYVGAIGSCLIGAFLVLLAAPAKVLWALLAYVIVQFVENQFIYPHVVGSSVGLAPLWILIAVLLGGKLFGLLGIIFFIPLTAVIYTLVKESAYKRLRKKDI